MQDLIDRFNSETVLLLCKRWPERFWTDAHGVAHVWINSKNDMGGGWIPIDPQSLDSLAAIAEACGFDTCAFFAGLKPARRWYSIYSYFDGNAWQKRAHEEIHPTELAARLAATIAAIAAVGGE